MKHCSVCHKDVKLGAVLFSGIHGLVAAPYTRYTDLSCSGPESKRNRRTGGHGKMFVLHYSGQAISTALSEKANASQG